MKPIYITESDLKKLREITKTVSPLDQNNGFVSKLKTELDRATVIEDAAATSDLVRLNSRVSLRFPDSDDLEHYTIVAPEHADPDQSRISVLAPIGTALIGFKKGDEVTWTMPGGNQQILIEEVEYDHSVREKALPPIPGLW